MIQLDSTTLTKNSDALAPAGACRLVRALVAGTVAAC